MSDVQNMVDSIPEDLRDGVDIYTNLVKELAGDNAEALTLYGAIGVGSFELARHRIQSVLVLKTVELDLLRQIADNGTKLGKAYVAAPLIMTADYIEQSLDTFPMEFIEIHQTRIHLFGEDYFSDFAIQDSDVRLQCERELKTILIGLRQGLLAAAGQTKVLSALETGTAEGLLRTLRGLLWLKGEKSAKPSTEVVAAVESTIGSRLDGIRKSLDVTSPHGWQQFQALYRDVEAIGAFVDAM